jgi:hypothetical protein
MNNSMVSKLVDVLSGILLEAKPFEFLPLAFSTKAFDVKKVLKILFGFLLLVSGELEAMLSVVKRRASLLCG